MFEIKAENIASFIGSKEIVGDKKRVISGVSPLSVATKNTLAFLFDEKDSPLLSSSKAGIIVLPSNTLVEKKSIETTYIFTKNARVALARLSKLAFLSKKNTPTGISSSATIEKGAKIGENVSIMGGVYISSNTIIEKNCVIYPHVFIGENVHIGESNHIYAGVKIYADTVIGKNCVFNAGSVIGSEGFGFAKNDENKYEKIHHFGNVIIEDDVDIGANTCIDKGTMGSTRIKKNTKIDNLVQIAHNVTIGESTVIAAGTAIAGSTEIGNNCTIAGQVGVVGHIKIGNNVIVAAQSGVTHSLSDNVTVLGTPALDIGKQRRNLAIFSNLGNLYKKVTKIEKKVFV